MPPKARAPRATLRIAVIKLGRLYDSQPLQPADWVPAEKTLFQRGALVRGRREPRPEVFGLSA